ncbi:MAG: hypothetical protein V3V75_07770, partial [Thermoguttaceae bacterium]
LGLNPLDEFQTIILLNVDHLDRTAVEMLESYISSGGGVGIFLGPRSRSNFINEELYRDGKGFFPVPLAGPEELPVDRLQKVADLEVGNHPIFRIFHGKRNNYISTVNIEHYFAVRNDWHPSPASTVKVIANLRNGAPLALENTFGRGRVVTFLTTLGPAWNNWGRNNPSFVVAMLDMQTFLCRRPREDISRQVGQPIKLRLDPAKYEPRVSFTTPGDGGSPTGGTDAVLDDGGLLAATLGKTDVAGVYRAKLTRTNGAAETRFYASNVEAEEGNTAALDGPKLAQRLQGLDYRYEQAAAFQYDEEELAGYDLSDALLYLLIILLIGEQILAYSASYHPPPSSHQREQGGVR